MWRHHHIVHLEQRIVGGCGLDLKDVKSGASELPSFKRLDKCRFVHGRPTASIDEIGRGLHRLEESLAYYSSLQMN